MSAFVLTFAASCCTTIVLFYDGNSQTISYIYKYTLMNPCRSNIGGPNPLRN